MSKDVNATGLDAYINVLVPGLDGTQALRGNGHAGAAPVAASRQKSCNTCVRGKRRCDKQTPRCGRCAARNIDCTYKRLRQRQAAAATTPSIPMSVVMSVPMPVSGSTSAVAPLSVSTSSVPTWSAVLGSAPIPIPAAAGDRGVVDTIDPVIGLDCSGPAFVAPVLAENSPSDSLELSFPVREVVAGPESRASGISPWEVHLENPGPTTASGSGSGSADGSGSGTSEYSSSSDNGGSSNRNGKRKHRSSNADNDGTQVTSVSPGGSSKVHVEIPFPPDAIRAALAALAAPDPMDDFFFSIDPDLVHDPRSKIGFVVHELTHMHDTFAQRRAAHFIHPRLYTSGGVPRSMVLAFAAAAAYAGHTRETKGWALKAVQYAVREVYQDAEWAATASRPVSEEPEGAPSGGEAASSAGDSQPDGSGGNSQWSNVCDKHQGSGGGLSKAAVKEKLARLQALVLLNCMRLFDGDLSSRAAAEREMGIMVSWTRELVDARRQMEEGMPASMLISRDRLPKSWEASPSPSSFLSWILLESLRRTTVTSIAVVFLLCVLRDGSTPCYLWAEDESFTASRHLWEAKTSIDFFRAWREKPQFCVTNMMFRDFWQGARPDDLDDFTKMMVTPQVGVEVIEHFVMGAATASA